VNSSDRAALSGVETAVQGFAEEVARSLPVTVASVALLDQPSCALTVKGVGMPRPLPGLPRVGTRIRLAQSPWHRAVLEQQQPLFLDGHGHPVVSLEGNGGHEMGLQAVYLLPIRIGEETIGVLGVGEMRSSAREAFTEQKRERCRAILEEFVAGSPHVWEAGRLRRQILAMSSLLRLAQDVMEARSPHDVLSSCVSEVADWLAVPTSGILFRSRPDGGMEPVAQRDLPEAFTDQDAVQLLLALVRTGVGARWPVSVIRVSDDPLDPLYPAMRSGESWTRIALPLMRSNRLQGIACLYVADDLCPSNWELEAFRRRGDLIGLALGAVGTLEDQRSERRWLGRAAYEGLTEQQRTGFAEAITRIMDLVSTHLPARLAGRVPETDNAGQESAEARPTAETVAEEIIAVLGPIRQRVDFPGPLRMEPLDINDIVRRAIEIAHARWDYPQDGPPPSVKYRVDASPEPLLAHASVALVGAVVHAIENAVEAMPEGGEIHVRTGRDSGHAVISVQDSGPGIAVPEDAFEPLVSTKGKRHLGLGLSVIRSVVNHHGGTASLVSRPEGGALLEIRLPLTRGIGPTSDEAVTSMTWARRSRVSRPADDQHRASKD
jgi:signal transduction histidine kinase